MPNQGASPSDYTAPVSEEERQAWLGKNYTSPWTQLAIFFCVLGAGFGIAYIGVLMMLSFLGFLFILFGGLLALVGLFGFLAVPVWQLLQEPEETLRKGVIGNRILNTHMDVLVRKYAQCSQVDEYGHKRFDDDRWQKEETRFRDTVWIPEALEFMSAKETKFHLERQGRLVNIVEAAYEGRTTGIIATFREDMNPFDYEHFCAAILNENGWNARATQGSGDQGVDVIAEKDACRVAIQCKLYSSNVGNKAVQEIIAGSIHVDADYRVVVSNRDYTKSAYEIAEKSKVRLLHHNDLQDLDRALGLASV